MKKRHKNSLKDHQVAYRWLQQQNKSNKRQ
jgi:hypothetical protein